MSKGTTVFGVLTLLLGIILGWQTKLYMENKEALAKMTVQYNEAVSKAETALGDAEDWRAGYQLEREKVADLEKRNQELASENKKLAGESAKKTAELRQYLRKYVKLVKETEQDVLAHNKTGTTVSDGNTKHPETADNGGHGDDPAAVTADATPPLSDVTGIPFELPKDVSGEDIKVNGENKNIVWSPSFHVVVPGGMAATFDHRLYGPFLGVEYFPAQTVDGDIKFGGVGLNWAVQAPEDDNRIALTVTPVSARIYKRLYGSGGYTHVFGSNGGPSGDGVHVQFSFCAFNCKEKNQE